MSEHASSSNVAKAVLAEKRKRKANGDKDSGIYDALSAEEATGKKSITTVLDLNEDCLNVVLDYLDVEDQLHLASSDVYFEDIFKRYASRHYKHLDESFTSRIGEEYVKQLLPIVGEHLISFESKDYPNSIDDQQLCLLLSRCTNIEHLRMTFNGTSGDDLHRLKKLKSLHACLDFEDEEDDEYEYVEVRKCTDFVNTLKHFTCLKKLKLDCLPLYSGKGLHALDQLESLELDVEGFDAKNLVDLCQTMKQLRYLKFDRIENMTRNHFEILANNFQQLERLTFYVLCLDSTVPYELVCQLPRLQHLQVKHEGSVRESFFEGLINKRGCTLESLILDGPNLLEAEVQHICNISSLKELYVSCDIVPVPALMKLENLLYLHIIEASTTNDELLDLVKALPRLKVLVMNYCFNINTVNLLNSVGTWISNQRQQREKIKIYLGNQIRNDILYANPLLEIHSGSIDPILINKELGGRDSDF